jgi:hypothetical protein
MVTQPQAQNIKIELYDGAKKVVTFHIGEEKWW